jgi:hypothetical protein
MVLEDFNDRNNTRRDYSPTGIFTKFAGVMWSTDTLNIVIGFSDTNTLMLTWRTFAWILF